MIENALIIFIKTPKAHFTKTRLIPFLTTGQAAEFYSCCIKDLYITFNKTKYFDTWFCCDPENFDAERIPFDFSSTAYFFQNGRDLGQKMYNAFADIKKKSTKKLH